MAEEVKEYLDYNGLTEYDKKSKALFQDLTIQDVEEAFNELDQSDPSYSAFYDVIQKAKEATSNADSKAAEAVTATNNANIATSNADKATDRANKAAERIETVNDYTTGINLIRGSRDFRQGITAAGTSTNVKTDGFYYTVVPEYSKKDNGCTVITYSASGLTADSYKQYVSSAIYGLTKNQKITVSFNVMVENIDQLSNKYCLTISHRNSAGSTQATENVSTTILGINEELKNGGWVTAIYHYEIPWDIIDSDYVTIALQLVRNGRISFSELMVQVGEIRNPIYSVAPADLSLEPVNDITNGINLLRGTRDFTLGSIPLQGTTTNTRYIDGFFNNGGFTFSKDEQGFTVASRAQSGLSADATKVLDSIIYPAKPNQDYTISVELMVDDISVFAQKSIVQVFYINKTSGSISGTSKTFYANDVAIEPLESGQWVKCVGHYTSPYDMTDSFILVRFTLVRNGSIHFRKPGVYEGFIINPEWSANPFDVATTAELYENTRYTLEDLFTPDDNFTITSRVLRVNGRMAQIYIYATTKIALKVNTRYTIGTLDKKIYPALHAGIMGYSSNSVCVTGMIANDTGLFRISVTGDIPANQQISMCSMYILASVSSPTAIIPNLNGTLVGQVPSLGIPDNNTSTLLPDGVQIEFQSPID